jgi:hypothetical protein
MGDHVLKQKGTLLVVDTMTNGRQAQMEVRAQLSSLYSFSTLTRLKIAHLIARRLTELLMHTTRPLDVSKPPRDAHSSQEEEETDIGRASPPVASLSALSSQAHSPIPPVLETNRKDLSETTPPPIDTFTHLPTLALLVLFSILGCLTRLGLTALFTYPEQAVFPLIWSQAVGSLLMGVCVGWRKDLERWGGKELYLGLGTGELQSFAS